MQRMSPMIRDVSRDPDPLFGSEGCGLATLSGVISDKAGPIIVEWAAAIQHVGPCRAPISEPWISTSQLGFHSYRLTRASFATRVQRTRFQDRWAVFGPVMWDASHERQQPGDFVGASDHSESGCDHLLTDLEPMEWHSRCPGLRASRSK